MTKVKTNSFLSVPQDTTSDYFQHRQIMQPSFVQLLNLSRFLKFNLIFIYSSLSNIWNSKELAPVILSKIIQTEWYAWDTAHTVNLTYPIIGSYITWLVKLIHSGHISTPTYVLSKLCIAQQPYAGHGGFNTPSACSVCCESEVSVCYSRTAWTQAMPSFCSHLWQAAG